MFAFFAFAKAEKEREERSKLLYIGIKVGTFDVPASTTLGCLESPVVNYHSQKPASESCIFKVQGQLVSDRNGCVRRFLLGGKGYAEQFRPFRRSDMGEGSSLLSRYLG